MGIRGLMTYVLQNKDSCVEYIDLVDKAREKQGIEILVDYYAFQQFIINRFWKSLASVTGNAYLRLEGGEYATLHQFIVKLIDDLEHVGIKLVFYVDAGKGVIIKQTDQKLETWKSRHHNDVKKFHNLLDVCHGSLDIFSLPEDINIRPVLVEVQITESLLQCNAEIIQCINEEADMVIGRDLQRREKAYSVLSNDSDFFLLYNCVFIPLNLFDVNNDLFLGENAVFTDRPIRLTSGVVTVPKVQELLGFQKHDELVEFAIIAGNDFTQPVFTSYIKDKLGIQKKPKFQELSEWVQRYRYVENHEFMCEEIHRNSSLKDAIHHSRDFYTLNVKVPSYPVKGPMTNYLVNAVCSGQLPSSVLGMHNNFYWHRMLLENAEHGHPCVEWTLAELRSYIYKIVLLRNEHMVVEYGRTPYCEMMSAGMKVAEQRPDFCIRTADYINPDKVHLNMKLFHNIITHQEPGFRMEFFNRYGRRNGFICYLLRYFLKMNWQNYLAISQQEFITLLASVFHRDFVDVRWYQTLGVKPDVRCVTICNWFQALYRYAYLFLGKLLHVAHEFPQPSDLFAGSVWTAFLMCSRTKFNFSNQIHILHDDLQRVYRDHKHIVKEKRHMTRYIVQDIFYYDDRL